MKIEFKDSQERHDMEGATFGIQSFFQILESIPPAERLEFLDRVLQNAKEKAELIRRTFVEARDSE